MPTYTYNFGANPAIDYPRMLIADTQGQADGTGFIFADQEIQAAAVIVGLQFQSSQFYSGIAGQTLPTTPVSYLRIAALLLDSIASNSSRLGGVIQLLDVKLGMDKAAESLRAQAKSYRETDDDAGAFFIIEQVNDQQSFLDRWWKQVQRGSIP